MVAGMGAVAWPVRRIANIRGPNNWERLSAVPLEEKLAYEGLMQYSVERAPARVFESTFPPPADDGIGALSVQECRRHSPGRLVNGIPDCMSCGG